MENLVLFCYEHHKETDDTACFGVEALLKMKRDHEARHGHKPFKVNEAFLHRLEVEMEQYWSHLSHVCEMDHVAPEYAVPVPRAAVAWEQFASIYQSLNRLGELLRHIAEWDGKLNGEIRSHLSSIGYDLTAFDEVPYYQNPFDHWNWELHSLAITNARADLFIAIKQAEVRFLEEYAKTNSSDANAVDKLRTARAELLRLAVSAGYAD